MKDVFTWPALLKSPRFQGVVVIAILQALVALEVLTGAKAEAVILIVQGVIGTAVTLRTVDRTVDKATK